MPNVSEQHGVATNDFRQPEKGDIDRRCFVSGLIAGFTAMMTENCAYARGGLAGRTADKFGTNAFLRSFPKAEEIPGIKYINTTLAPNAHKSIIVLRQIHWMEGLWHTDRADELQEVIECQRDLYHAIKFLQEDKRTRMNHLFVEGLSDGKKRAPVQHETLRKRWSPEWNHVLAWHGAEGVRQDESELLLLGAENEDLKRRVDANMHKKGWDYAARNGVFDPREDAFLDIASHAEYREIYVIYGAGHHWMNNIEKWNRLHPERHYSLCELTPITFAQRRSESGRSKRMHPMSH